LQIDPWNSQDPIGFPWVDPRDRLEHLKANQDKKVFIVDADEPPPPPRVSVLQNMDGTDMTEDQLIFLQLPTILPITTQKKDETGLHEHFHSTIRNEQLSGFIGKMLFYKSGKVEMQLGEIKFDITSGSKAQFLQEVYVVKNDTKEVIKLGELAQRLLMTPNMEYILEKSLDDIHIQAGTDELFPSLEK